MKTLQSIQTSKLQQVTKDSVSLVTKDNWQGFCKHVKNKEGILGNRKDTNSIIM
jgi:hypothetical protein